MGYRYLFYVSACRSELPVWFLRESVQAAAERRRRASTPLGGVGRLPAVQFADILHDDGRLRWLQTIGNVNATPLRNSRSTVLPATRQQGLKNSEISKHVHV